TLSPPLKKRILGEFCDSGPLLSLIENLRVTEICVNGSNQIWYEIDGQLQSWQDRFFSGFTYENFIQRVFSDARVHIDLCQPAVDGSWKEFRIHAVGKPLSPLGTVLTLRRHPQNSWTLEKLEEHGWACRNSLEKIANLVRQKQTILIAGPTGSGKTSILSACLKNLAANERRSEERRTREIALPNPISLQLLTREDLRTHLPRYTLSDLIRHSLRMRPDRLIMGEVRGPEAKDLVLLLSTGHQGGLATIHARDPHEALMRLEILIQLGAPQWRPETVRKLIFHGVQYVLLTERLENGQRQFAGAYRLSSLESTGFLLDREF
ncbi:MAG: CpaF family protein, partial [Bdellovibrionales bacterium]|nr:CpaF family protein [Bdellovibrionales bacterium]